MYLQVNGLQTTTGRNNLKRSRRSRSNKIEKFKNEYNENEQPES